jgi:conserved oligomeric Golgi complex subunit 3
VCIIIHDWVLAQSPKSPPPAAAVVEELDQNFRLSCHRDLRAAVTKMRLYLEDDRTVNVLLSHVQDKIVDEYIEFRHTVAEGSGDATSLSVQGLKEMLQRICKEEIEQ